MEFLTVIHFSSLLLEVPLNGFNVKQNYTQLHREQLIQPHSKVFREAILSEKKLVPHTTCFCPTGVGYYVNSSLAVKLATYCGVYAVSCMTFKPFKGIKCK